MGFLKGRTDISLRLPLPYFCLPTRKNFWGDAVLTVTYLINRMPSRILGFSTPLDKFQGHFPTSRLNSNLPLKIFGCTTFVHVYSHHRTKLDPRSIKCVFIGYSPTKKGYKYYDPITRKVFVTLDVIFFETIPYYSKLSL